MQSKLVNGDYAKDGAPLTVSYIEELLQNAFVALNTKRESFYPNKSFGSKIRMINRRPVEEYAFAYACQALEGLDGVFVKGASLTDNGVIILLAVNGTQGQVNIELENNI